MIKFSIHSFVEYICKQHKIWIVYISWADDLSINLENKGIKAAPYLTFNEDYQIIADTVGIIKCSSEKEAEKVFNLTVGDDGPTKLNSYNGNVRVYALICGPDGFTTENT